MKLPDKVVVAGVVYSITQVENVIVRGSVDYLGSCGYHPPEIEIRQDSTDARKLDTYIHELTHAMMFEARLKHDDEDFVQRFSKILTQVVQDNNWNVGVEYDKS